MRSLVLSATVLVFLIGCSTFNTWLPASGPARADIKKNLVNNKTDPSAPTVHLIALNDSVLRQINTAQRRTQFSTAFSQASINRNLVGPGDVLDVNVWEASPSMLFGVSSNTSTSSLNPAGPKAATTFPDQMVNSDGNIAIPFAGSIKAAGKTTQVIGQEIADALKNKANLPQVMVRMTRNTTSNVTVVGEVSNSQLIPLTPKQERLLDAIAASGGVKQAINKITIQLARKGEVHSMPLESIIKDPLQNINLSPGDVITAYYQPYSFTALGATGQNQEVSFEAQGISLVQALARVGGLQDQRADPRGVFIFRFEDPEAVPELANAGIKTADNKVPVIYQVNMTEASTFLLAQDFPMKNKDVVYISNATSAELQKFLNILVSGIYPVVNINNILKNGL